MLRPHSISSSARKGFTLIELLVATTVFLVITGLLMSILSQASNVWQSGSQKIAAFQNARLAFERVTRQLSQATLNTYWEYDDPNNPQRYIRKSELHFRTGPNLLGTASHAVFFQSPAQRSGDRAKFGRLNRLLNGCGFFIDYVDDDIPTPFQEKVTSRKRFRLMQWTQNTEELLVSDPGATDPDDWYHNARTEASVVADNVIALLIEPRLPPNEPRPSGWVHSYDYDSRAGAMGTNQPLKQHQLPPVLQVVMIAIDAKTAERLGDDLKDTIDSAMQGLFTTADPNEEGKALSADLAALEGALQANGIRYQIFESAVALKEAKWSRK